MSSGHFSISCCQNKGPIFGKSHPNQILMKAVFSNFGVSYEHPSYPYTSDKAKNILAGSKTFQTV